MIIIINRRFFRKGLPRTYHVHIVEQDSVAMTEHLAFRDALRADADLRRRYTALKTELASRHKNDRASYTAGKSEFVSMALAMQKERRQW